ncbi:ATG22 domain containing protein [Curvularia clavata]|uniref:Autophagy-related protein n=1 Tax=Curvularia clavata TaxID=95742 RepID=A0A9Q8ZD44_CURCL|nr:ATG22 domain containing protein [Curvularia clavata]
MSFSDEDWVDPLHTSQDRHPTRYENEDTSPTTERELKGWYAYPIAAEADEEPKKGAFLPVLLEQLARENGVFFSDHSKPCVDHHATAQSSHTARDADGQHKNSEQCMVRYLGFEMSTSSLALYTSSAAVLLQALVLICFSSFADHGIASFPLSLNYDQQPVF